ncbi:chaperone activator Sti1 [Schizosaccharomyces cryophilus OY26]|uniref:Chaperone activator Sti1 n=1 Tax=Schizosaccharomyces cryophilus (strain OY26 / ATCC MYA-4695 / CBS 11777 / NBRC 106824 / NRRL Y48691) TaxID=653667 RepID=S9XA34_SCHCR|nr:chaperone activator Sti1 [Schizosaccharomyces cryophilus OY26]EPY50621.1 chaperone activator Sti1 [Schizosaccharomyces cryophilus OY26]
MAEELKAKGNAAFAQKDYKNAIDYFTQAIQLDGSNHILYSNRSACYASEKNYRSAVEDATKCTNLKPDWAKGWSRKGAALHGLGDLSAAKAAYEEGLKFDPRNAQLLNGLKSVEAAQSSAGGDGGFNPFAKMTSQLNDPKFIEKLASNPETSSLLGDAGFMTKLQNIQKNPGSIMSELNDPRMMKVIGMLMGIDINMKGEDDAAANDNEATPSESPKFESAPKEEAKPEPAAQPMEEDKSPEEIEEQASEGALRKKADEAKQIGNENYKKRNFPVAIENYKKAWDTYKDITYLNNLAAAYYEADELDNCESTCKEAIEQGRELRADFKLIAKALGRLGTTYQKRGDLATAIEYYQRSLTEHRSPDTLTKLKDVEKLKEKQDRESYINPDKADEARSKGNDLFKSGDFAGAIKEYTEMTKRAPTDPRGFGNRAAAYLKVMAPAECIRDCNQAIQLDPLFAKAYVRKAQALFMLKDYGKCIDACNAAADVDRKEPNTGKNIREIESQLQKCMNAMAAQRQNETEEETMARIQNDPDVLAILQDPAMQAILGQARENPAALMEHMKSPVVKSKIDKLIASGVIRLG